MRRKGVEYVSGLVIPRRLASLTALAFGGGAGH